MDKNTMNDRLMRRATLLPGRALWAGIPATMAAVSFLWITGYPAEEWPFIGAVLAGCMFLSGTLVGLTVFFVGRWLDQYGRRVLLQRGIDEATLDQRDKVPGAVQLGIVLAAVLPMSATIWGASLLGVVLVVSRMDMPPLGYALSAIGPVLLGLGACGLLLVFGAPAALFFLLNYRSRGLVSSVVRARGSAARTVLSLASTARLGPAEAIQLGQAVTSSRR